MSPCTELGVCQDLEQPGPDCSCMHDPYLQAVARYYFAPGTVQTMPRRARRMHMAARVFMVVVFLALVALIAFATGALWGRI